MNEPKNRAQRRAQQHKEKLAHAKTAKRENERKQRKSR